MKPIKGRLIQRNKNGPFTAVWSSNGQRFMKSTGTANRREAEKLLKEFVAPFAQLKEKDILEAFTAKLAGAQAEAAIVRDKLNPPLTIKQAWDAYERSPNRPDSGERTLNDYLGYWNAFENWIGAKYRKLEYLRDITKEVAEQYAERLTILKLSPSSYNKHIFFLKLMFRILTEQARLTVNPWEQIRQKKVVSHSRRDLTIEELKEVILTSEGELRLLFAIGIYTGLRLGDAATLRWGEVDLHRGVIARIPNKTARRKNEPALIPIHNQLHDLLIQIKKRGEYVLPESAEEYLRDSAKLSKRIQKHFEACGIVTHKQGTGTGTGKRAIVEVGFHSLRHSFVSLARTANVPLTVVEKIVGHSSPAMTRHYSHVGTETARNAIECLPAIGGNDNTTPAIETRPASNTELLQARIKTLAESMNAKNWKTIKAELLNLAKEATP